MARKEEKVTVKVGLDYAELANSVDMVREMVMSLVAALVAEGFTSREARIVITGVFAIRSEEEKP